MKIKDEKGIATVLGFIVIMVLSILASSMLVRGVSSSRRTESYIDQNRAFWVAEAGLSYAIWELENGAGAWSGWTTNGNDKYIEDSIGSSGDYDITVNDYLSSPLVIEVTGYYPNRASASAIVRSLEFVAEKNTTSLFEYAAYSESELTIGGQGYTDSYDSSQGAYGGANVGSSGDVGSGVEVDASGQASVDGDIVIPVGADHPDAKYYTGSVTEQDNPELESVSVPASLTALPNGGSISSTTSLPSGDYQYWMINLSSSKTLTVTGPANIYLTGSTSISVTANASIVVDAASTGPVNVYFDGDVKLAGQGVTNETNIPANLIMYGTNSNSQTVNITGANDFHGAIYAPTATLNLSGQGGLFGSFIGDEVNITGQGGVHFDTDLANASGAGVITYAINAFKDSRTPYNLSQ